MPDRKIVIREIRTWEYDPGEADPDNYPEEIETLGELVDYDIDENIYDWDSDIEIEVSFEDCKESDPVPWTDQ